MRVLFMTNMPSPYRVDFFNELGKYCELTVMFERDRDHSRDARYKAGRFKQFKAVFPKGIPVGDAEAFCPTVVRLLSKEKFDCIIVGNYYSPTGMLAIEYMHMRRIPFILSTDGGMIKENSGFKYRLKRHFIGSASGWLSTGKMTTDYLVHYGADREKTTIYPFTSLRKSDILTVPLTKEEKRTLRQKLGIKEKKIVISVGQFIYRKGYDVLFNACADLNEEIGVYIIGGTPTEDYLKMKADLHLDRVHFVDFMSKRDLAEYYKAADLFVLPTREDIWGLVINEAMAYGLPVVTTDCCVAGVELVEKGITGQIVPAEDVNQLRAAIIENVDYLDSIPQACLQKIGSYTIEEMAKRHVQYLKEKMLWK